MANQQLVKNKNKNNFHTSQQTPFTQSNTNFLVLLLLLFLGKKGEKSFSQF